MTVRPAISRDISSLTGNVTSDPKDECKSIDKSKDSSASRSTPSGILSYLPSRETFTTLAASGAVGAANAVATYAISNYAASGMSNSDRANRESSFQIAAAASGLIGIAATYLGRKVYGVFADVTQQLNQMVAQLDKIMDDCPQPSAVNRHLRKQYDRLMNEVLDIRMEIQNGSLNMPDVDRRLVARMEKLKAQASELLDVMNINAKEIAEYRRADANDEAAAASKGFQIPASLGPTIAQRQVVQKRQPTSPEPASSRPIARTEAAAAVVRPLSEQQKQRMRTLLTELHAQGVDPKINLRYYNACRVRETVATLFGGVNKAHRNHGASAEFAFKLRQIIHDSCERMQPAQREAVMAFLQQEYPHLA